MNTATMNSDEYRRVALVTQIPQAELAGMMNGEMTFHNGAQLLIKFRTKQSTVFAIYLVATFMENSMHTKS